MKLLFNYMNLDVVIHTMFSQQTLVQVAPPLFHQLDYFHRKSCIIFEYQVGSLNKQIF